MSNSQINLPKTAFSMKANLPTREPEILKFWEEINLYQELRNSRKGKEKLKRYDNLNWIVSPAEKLPLPDNSYDLYTISFGLRNTRNLDKALLEAYRVLKPGGRYLCLEFSKIQNSNLNFMYKNYSKLIPSIGKLIVGKSEPYEYLIKSIEDFLNQEELIELMKKNNFKKCTYRNLSGGIVSIHSGWKI